MSTEREREILAGFVAGRKEDVDVVVGWVRDVVRHSAWGHEDSVEDLVSDTVIKLLRLLGSGEFRGESSLKTYVSRVARYTAVDFARHERRSRLLLTEENVPTANVPTPEDLYAQKEAHRLFDRLLELVDPRCKRLWEMIFARHLTYAEIAAQEGVSATAIKVRVYRCKEEAVAIGKRMRSRIPGGISTDHRSGGRVP
jgi:RNA polymerase sigma factor (sigma-70 family)